MSKSFRRGDIKKYQYGGKRHLPEHEKQKLVEYNRKKYFKLWENALQGSGHVYRFYLY